MCPHDRFSIWVFGIHDGKVDVKIRTCDYCGKPEFLDDDGEYREMSPVVTEHGGDYTLPKFSE